MDLMGIDTLKFLVTQGSYAALFVWLLFYVMKTNREREARLHELLDKFSEKYDVVIDKLDRLEYKIDSQNYRKEV